jgi:hypothetical protein
MTEKSETDTESKRFKIYIRPQAISDCFIATMDPKNPMKICLYPSVKSGPVISPESDNQAPDEIENLVLYNYLKIRRICTQPE